jgi:type IV secretion system protein VirB9
MKRHGRLLLVLSFLSHPTSWAETVPSAGPVDARVRYATYDADEVYKLRGFIGYQIDLEFEAGEVFSGLGAGDMEGLAFVGRDNHLFLKPKALKVATNITILTNRRHYQLDYAASPHVPGADDEVVYALHFNYPPSKAQQARSEDARTVDASLRDASAHRPSNVDYWYCGDPTLRPVAASDDGVHTRLTFAANAELPVVFVRNDDDTESLLNFSMDAGDVVIHRVARRFVLRRGRLTGCVINQHYAGSGSRLSSGTVSTEVRRKVKGVSP